MTSVLPPDWRDVLSRVASWLETAATDHARRETAFSERFPPAAAEPVAGPATQSPLSEVSARMAGLEEASDKADRCAQAEEDLLRERVQRSERLRLKLAERLGRAIG